MARKKTTKKVAKKTTRKKTTTRSAPRTGGESALTGQGPSWWKVGKPVDPGFRRAVQDDEPTRSLPPSIPVGIYPQTKQPAAPPVTSGLELFGDELGELDSEYLPDDMIPLDAELTTDVDDVLNGEHEAVESLFDGSLEDLFSEVVPKVAPEVAPEVVEVILEDTLDDDLDATEYFPPDVDGLLEVPQDVLDVVEEEMPLEDDSGIADPADFVDLFGVDEEPEVEPDAIEEPPEPPVVEEPVVEEPVFEEPVFEEPVVEEPVVEEPVVEEPVVEVTSPTPVASPPAESAPAPSPSRDPLIVTVLQGLNYPLRALSPSSRVVVDWVAWSLIFWVPVVWAIAIVVVGR